MESALRSSLGIAQLITSGERDVDCELDAPAEPIIEQLDVLNRAAGPARVGLRELGPTGALVNHLIDKASATPPF